MMDNTADLVESRTEMDRFLEFTSMAMAPGSHIQLLDPIPPNSNNIRNPNLPQYLRDPVFLSILHEIGDFMTREKDFLLIQTVGMSEQDAMSYVSTTVMDYLNSEKDDLMNTLSNRDNGKSIKLFPKINTYISVIYQLTFTDKNINQIHKSITIKHQYVTHVKNLLSLNAPSRFSYNIENIKGILHEINKKDSLTDDNGYRLIYPQNQVQFNLLEGDSSGKQLVILCPEGIEHSITPSYIKNDMLQNGKRCIHVSARIKAKIKYNWDLIESTAARRKDRLITTEGQWDTMTEANSNRIIRAICGRCGEIRTARADLYIKNERCPNDFHLDQSLSIEQVREKGLARGYELKTPRIEFNTIKSANALDPDKDWRQEDLEWKCLDCKEKVKLSYIKLSDRRTACPSCKMTNHQKRVHKYNEATFGVPFRTELTLGKLAEIIGVSSDGFNPALTYDGYALVHVPGSSEPIHIVFEARGEQYAKWPNRYHPGTREGLLQWEHYRENAKQKDSFAYNNKVVVISIYDQDRWSATTVREQLILQFRSQTKAFGFSNEGISLNPPQYDERVFSRRFLGSLN